MKIAIVTLLVYLINIPFGLWRAKQVKKSPKWFLAIHLPIPAVIFLRIYSGMGFQLWTYPLLVGAFFLGQYTGGKLNRHPKESVESKEIIKN